MDKLASLTPIQRSILMDKGTESPFTGKYTDTALNGTYLCRNCGIALFRADNKFHSACGWPSFDASISSNVTQQPDIDGRHFEIICSRCKSHLGHIFIGEGFTPLNTRYCVNSACLDFVPNTKVNDSEEIILAAGCFWGVEYYLQKLQGVLLTQVGYCGGTKENPTYREVCTKATNHLECVRVVFDPSEITLENLIKYFFEIHDSTQIDGQGNDIGNQYLSAVFCYNEEQKKVVHKIISILTEKSYKVATTVRAMAIFWPAEEYHQEYYKNNGESPYCHKYTKIF